MNRLTISVLALGLALSGCKSETSSATTRAPLPIPAVQPAAGELVVVGTLEPFEGPLPANDLYKYAYIFKYKVDTVVKGEFVGGEILVGHYDPRTPRGAIADDQKGKVGGDVDGFHAGDRHYMVLRPMDSAWTGAIEDGFQDKAPRWFAAWASKI